MKPMTRVREGWRQREGLLPKSWHVGGTERRPSWLEHARVREAVVGHEVTELGRGRVGSWVIREASKAQTQAMFPEAVNADVH